MQPTDQQELKLKFAAAIVAQPSGDLHKAALSIPGITVNTAMQIAVLWANDDEVLEEKKRLMSSSECVASALPSKEQHSKMVLELANNPKIDPQDRLKFHELYAKLRGFIEKPIPPPINNPNLIIGRNVMVIEHHGSDEDWEKQAVECQKKLINGEPDSVN